MIKVSATPAHIRKKKILDAVKDMNFDKDSYTQKFGILVDNKTVQFEGNYSLKCLVYIFFNEVKMLIVAWSNKNGIPIRFLKNRSILISF